MPVGSMGGRIISQYRDMAGQPTQDFCYTFENGVWYPVFTLGQFEIHGQAIYFTVNGYSFSSVVIYHVRQ